MPPTSRVSPEDRLFAGGDAPAARPYRLFGLVVSIVLILAASLILTGLAGVAAVALSGLLVGWNETFQRLGELRETVVSDKVTLQRAGVVLSLILYAALSISVLAAARFRGGPHWRDLLAWHAWHPFRGARLFWVLSFCTIVYGFGADALVSNLYPPSRDWIVLPSGPIWIALFVVLAIVFAPVTEELFFRGWLYTSLRPVIGIWSSILVTTLLFALAHWEATHLYALIVAPVGLMLGLIREKTGSLLASMAFHALFNGAASVVLLLGQ